MKYFLFTLLTLVVINSFGQVEVNRLNNIVQSVSSGSAAYGAGFKGVAAPAGKVDGDPYLDSAFRQTSFKFSNANANAKLEAPSRYDLLNNEIEVKTTAGIRTIKNDLVKSYKSLKGRDSIEYINASAYKFEDTKLIGFLVLLSDGKLQLLKQVRLEITKPTYNASVDVGDRDTHILKKEALMVASNGELFKMKGKKDLLTLFGDQRAAVESFAESNKLGFKREDDLVKIFNFYNSQVK